MRTPTSLQKVKSFYALLQTLPPSPPSLQPAPQRSTNIPLLFSTLPPAGSTPGLPTLPSVSGTHEEGSQPPLCPSPGERASRAHCVSSSSPSHRSVQVESHAQPTPQVLTPASLQDFRSAGASLCPGSQGSPQLHRLSALFARQGQPCKPLCADLTSHTEDRALLKSGEQGRLTQGRLRPAIRHNTTNLCSLPILQR